MDLQLQDQLATDAFLKGLRNQKVAYEVMNRDPCSLAEAQKCVEAHEHNFKATVGPETEIKKRARQISWADDGDICEDLTTTSRRVQTPQYVTADQFATLTDQVKTLVYMVGNLRLQFEHFLSTYAEHQQSRATTQLPLPPERKQNHHQVHPSRMRSQSPSPNHGAAGPCFKCGEPGHFRRDCMTLQNPTAPPNHGDKDPDQWLKSEGTLKPYHQPQRLQIGCT